MDILKSAKIYILTVLAMVFTIALSSCGDLVFDDEGDCEVVHKIRFVYNRNLKWADAFPSEVKSVNLYVFDSNGVFVKEYVGRGDELSAPDYSIVLDLPAGDYKFVAWCGLDNEGTEEASFIVTKPVVGVTTIEELTCSLNAKTNYVGRVGDNGAEFGSSDRRLDFLYHGYMDISIVDNHDGKEYVHTMYLTKDTNHIRIILQELSYDEGLNPDDYSISIEAANGLMAYNNTLLGNSVVRYTPWNQETTEVGVGRVDVGEGSIKYVKGLVADLSVGRMMASHQNDMMLTITDNNTKEKIIARVPVIQYALMSREYYEMAYGHTMTDQEFLDREDEYVMTFFLYENKWLDAFIDILSWRIVIHNYDVGS